MGLKNKALDLERVSNVQRTSQPRARTSIRQKQSSPHAVVLQRAITLPSSALRPRDVHALQRTVGNRAVRQILQAKLAVGPANDHYEQEADRVSASVMSESAAPQIQRQGLEEEEAVQTKPLASSITPLVQRQEVSEDEEDTIQTKPLTSSIQRQETDEDETPVQMRSDGSQASVKPGVEHAIERARGGGHPLPDGLLARMQNSFGADFSAVRVHADSESDSLNRSLHARAFTTGHDLFFKHGEYSPDSRRGQELIAHELTHVVQQNGGTSGKKNLSLKRSSTPVIQRGVLDWFKRKFGGAGEYADQKRGEFKKDVQGEYGNYIDDQGREQRRTNYNEDLKLDVANYSALLATGGFSAGRVIGDRGTAGLFAEGVSPLSDAGKTLAGVGAGSAAAGIITSAIDTYRGVKELTDKTNSMQQRSLAGSAALVGLGNVGQSTATMAFHSANAAKDTVAAAGAEGWTGGIALVTGALDMMRGYHAMSQAKKNLALLQLLHNEQENKKIAEAARQTRSTQEMRKTIGGYTMAKGALTAIGGGLLAFSVATPVGWTLIGIGAIVGLIGAINRWRDKKKRKIEIVARLVGLDKELDDWNNKVKAVWGSTKGWQLWKRPWRNWREERKLGDNPVIPKIEAETKRRGFISIDHYYANYIHKTANDLHKLGVDERKNLEREAETRIDKWKGFRKRLRKGTKESLKTMSFDKIVGLEDCGDLTRHVYGDVVKIVIGMGLKPGFGKRPPTPTPEKIGKALHE